MGEIAEMNTEYARMLFAYNVWANHLVLDKAAAVSEADYAASAEGISFGSLRGTLLHLIGTESGWLSRWKGEEEAEALTEQNTPDLAALRERWLVEEERQRVYLDSLSDDTVAGTVNFTFRNGRTGSQPLWLMIVHLINHGTQFRSEAAVRLTQVGQSPGNLDLFIYLRLLSEN